jgi:hypothetical protein
VGKGDVFCIPWWQAMQNGVAPLALGCSKSSGARAAQYSTTGRWPSWQAIHNGDTPFMFVVVTCMEQPRTQKCAQRRLKTRDWNGHCARLRGYLRIL